MNKKIICGSEFEYIDNLKDEVEKTIVEMIGSTYTPDVIITIEKKEQ